VLGDLKNCLLFNGEILIIVDDFKWDNIHAAVVGFYDIAKIKGRCPVVNENTNENLCIMKVPAIANKTN
jgi:hypothetical protein